MHDTFLAICELPLSLRGIRIQHKVEGYNHKDKDIEMDLEWHGCGDHAVHEQAKNFRFDYLI